MTKRKMPTIDIPPETLRTMTALALKPVPPRAMAVWLNALPTDRKLRGAIESLDECFRWLESVAPVYRPPAITEPEIISKEPHQQKAIHDQLRASLHWRGVSDALRKNNPEAAAIFGFWLGMALAQMGHRPDEFFAAAAKQTKKKRVSSSKAAKKDKAARNARSVRDAYAELIAKHPEAEASGTRKGWTKAKIINRIIEATDLSESTITKFIPKRGKASYRKT